MGSFRRENQKLAIKKIAVIFLQLSDSFTHKTSFMLHTLSMKLLFGFFVILSPVLAIAETPNADLRPSSEITYMPENTTLGATDGTWCSITVTSASNILKGLGSMMYKQVDSLGEVENAPTVGAVRAGSSYKFLLKGDDLTVEVRDSAKGALLCTLSGNQKKVEAKGVWVWPSVSGGPLDGIDFCNQNTPLKPEQQSEAATLKVECK